MNKIYRFFLFSGFLFCLILSCFSYSWAGSSRKYTLKTDPVLKALSAELSRSMPVLRKAEKIPLYFLGYEVIETKKYELSSEMGRTSYEYEDLSRQLDIDARFGSYELDNTHQVKGEDSYSGDASFSQHIPVEDDIDSLRVSIWQHTDYAVKRAYEAFTKVQMNKALTAEEEDDTPDFSPYKARTFYKNAELPVIDKDALKKKINHVSALMKQYPFIYSGNIWFSAEADNRYIVNSDGARIKTGQVYLTLSLTVNSRTEDGMDVYRSRSYHGLKMEDFPSDSQLESDFRKAAEELNALRNAPLIEPFSGPAIMNARAAGVYFHEIIGHRFEGHRQKQEDSGQTFAKKLNEKITADFISVYDDPNVSSWNGIPLRGHYDYDDEGVKAEKAVLIENGVLKGFMMSRYPIRGFARSNGHGRKSAGYPVAVSRMGNTIVRASETMTYDKLREKLIEEIKRQGKPFGLIFDDISGGFTHTGRGTGQSFKVNPLMVYKAYADGRPDELVRGVDLVGTPLSSFAKIAAAADDYAVFNGSCGAETGWVPVSAIAPSMLISEVEVEKSQKSQQKLPVLPPPASERYDNSEDSKGVKAMPKTQPDQSEKMAVGNANAAEQMK